MLSSPSCNVPGSHLPNVWSGLLAGREGGCSVSLFGEVMFLEILRASPTPGFPKNLDFQVRKDPQEAPPIQAGPLGHQGAYMSTGHCCTCLLSPRVCLGMRLEGHLSDGDRLGFSKGKESDLCPWPEEASSTTSRRERREHADPFPSQSPVSGLSWL